MQSIHTPHTYSPFPFTKANETIDKNSFLFSLVQLLKQKNKAVGLCGLLLSPALITWLIALAPPTSYIYMCAEEAVVGEEEDDDDDDDDTKERNFSYRKVE